MNQEEFEAVAKRYREELVRLYAKQAPQVMAELRQANVNAEPVATLPADVETGLHGSLPTEEVLRDADAPIVREITLSFPEETAEALPTGTGTLLISVRAAEEATPIADATVIVTSDRNGESHLMAIAKTDASGKVEPISLPAPTGDADLKNVPYRDYTVNIYKPGFLRASAMDVSIFAGTETRQDFSMLPVPHDFEGQDTVTFYNEEPNF